jgi:hypothetical protein
VKRRRHDHDLRVIDRPAKRRAQTIGGNRSLATTSTFITCFHISLADGNRLASISAIGGAPKQPRPRRPSLRSEDVSVARAVVPLCRGER